MNTYSTTVPLITFKRSLKIDLFVLCGLMLLGMYFFSFFWWGNNLKVVFFFGGLVALRIAISFKNYDQIGVITLDLNKILIKEEEDIQSYNIQDFKEIKILLMEIQGEFYSTKVLFLKQGSNNYIKFNYHEEEKKFQFLLEEHQVVSLRAIFEGWKRMILSLR